MIGIFDSGSGGLTVLKEIRKRLPNADIVYFGDIKNAPYGVRSTEELAALTVAAIRLLEERGATNIVSACNSVSAALALSLVDGLAPERLIEMVGPTVASFAATQAKILLVATPATVNAEIYQNAFRTIGKEIDAIAIEKLAGEIEFGEDDRTLEHTIRNALTTYSLNASLDDASGDPGRLGLADTLLLGCTHYPFARDLFARVVPGMKVVDPAVAVAERVATQFAEEGGGTTRFLISADSAPFRTRVANLWPEGAYSIEVLD
jgi:glutamate racemase